jgi:hypothetical protein
VTWLSGSLELNVEDKEVTPGKAVHVDPSHWDSKYLQSVRRSSVT